MRLVDRLTSPLDDDLYNYEGGNQLTMGAVTGGVIDTANFVSWLWWVARIVVYNLIFGILKLVSFGTLNEVFMTYNTFLP